MGTSQGFHAEITAPTVLALDNLQFTPLPEPGIPTSMAAAAIVLGLTARRRAAGTAMD